MAEESNRLSGVVKWFNGQKGFGFITPDDGTEDLFVHQSSIKADGYRSLADGEAVEFVIETGENGKTKAVDVTGPDGSFVQGTRKDTFGGYSAGRGASRAAGFGFNSGGGGGGGCFNCGGSGHLARDCMSVSGGGGGGSCYKCGEQGHFARDCYKGESGGGGGGGGGCYTCGEQGHLARDCAKGGGGGNGGRFGRSGGGSCYNCGAQGHFARECPDGTSVN
ncbi:hypothetical protein Scep_020776 [Stephania cephalantha]|uniref:Uncharacterized protein n=1 Tax=Stephania cephalantha TaxID=152367 RepID=A0AAP0NMT1_9MAGN